MLKTLLLIALLVPFNIACAQQTLDVTTCPFSDKVKESIEAPPNAEIAEQRSGIDKDSYELTRTHIVKFENGDVATIEQKYCSMYNFSVIYQVSALSETSFHESLQNIHRLIKSVGQDYRLKAPLENIVDMTMNQRGLSLQGAFSYGLPSQSASSASYVEHSVSFDPSPDDKTADAEILFYFALGGA